MPTPTSDPSSLLIIKGAKHNKKTSRGRTGCLDPSTMCPLWSKYNPFLASLSNLTANTSHDFHPFNG